MRDWFYWRARYHGNNRPALCVPACLEALNNAMDGEFDLAALEKRLEELEQEHRALDEEVRALTMCGVVDQLKVMRLKRRKLQLKDEIYRIEDVLNPDIIA